MFVCNIQLGKSRVKRIFLVLVVFVLIVSLFFGIYTLFKNTRREHVKDDIKKIDVAEISSENYTSVLKNCNENIDSYVGKKIKFVGFVYRLYDFNEKQFVLAREMVIKQISKTQVEAVVVGFLCDFKDASIYEDGTWIEVEGTIEKGYYHSEIPVVKISTIKKTQCPENPYVYPPDNSYVATEVM